MEVIEYKIDNVGLLCGGRGLTTFLKPFFASPLSFRNFSCDVLIKFPEPDLIKSNQFPDLIPNDSLISGISNLIIP
jgi:hypothetical protein